MNDIANETDPATSEAAAAAAAATTPRGKFDPQEPEKKRRRRWPGCLALLLVLGLVLLLALPYLIPTASLRKMVEERVREATGQTCSLTALSFGWWDGVRLEGFKLGSAGDPLRVEIQKATADASWMPLLSKRITNLDIRVTGLRAWYHDPAAGLDLDWTVPTFRLNAADLDEVATFQIQAHPGASEAAGLVTVEGKASLVRSMAFNPAGWAQAIATFKALDLAVVAAQAGQAETVSGGTLEGGLAVDFKDGLAAVTPNGLVARGVRMPSGEAGLPARSVPTTTLARGTARFAPATNQLTFDSLALVLPDAATILFDGGVNLAETNLPGLPVGKVMFSGDAEVAPLLAVLADGGWMAPPPVAAAGKVGFAGAVEMPRVVEDEAHPLKASVRGRSGELQVSGGGLPGTARMDISELRADAVMGPALASVSATVPLSNLSPRLFLDDGRGTVEARLSGQATVSGALDGLTAVVEPGGTELVAAGLPEGLPELRGLLAPEAKASYRLADGGVDAENVVFALYRGRDRNPALSARVTRLSGRVDEAIELRTPPDAPLRLDADLEALTRMAPPSLTGGVSLRGQATVLAGLDMAGDLLRTTLGAGTGVRGLEYRDAEASVEALGDWLLSGAAGYDGRAGVVTAEGLTLQSQPLAVSVNARVTLEPLDAQVAYMARLLPDNARNFLRWLGVPADLLGPTQATGVLAYRDGFASFANAEASGQVMPGGGLPPQQFSVRHDLQAAWNEESIQLTIPDGKPLSIEIGGGQIFKTTVEPGAIAVRLGGDFAWNGTLTALMSGRLDSARPYLLALARLAGGGEALVAELSKSDAALQFDLNATVTPTEAKARIQTFRVQLKNAQNADFAVLQAGPAEATVAMAGTAAAGPVGQGQVGARGDLAALREWGLGLLAAAPSELLGLDADGHRALLESVRPWAASGMLAFSAQARWDAHGAAFATQTEIADAVISENDGTAWQTLARDPKLVLQATGTMPPDGNQIAFTKLVVAATGNDPKAPTIWLQAAEDARPLGLTLEPFAVSATPVRLGLPDVTRMAAFSPAYWPADLLLTGGLSGSFEVGGPLSALRFANGVLQPANLVYRTGVTADDVAVTLPQGATLSWAATLNLEPPPAPGPGEYASLAAFDVTEGQLALDMVGVAAGPTRMVLRDIRTPVRLVGGVLDFGKLTARADPPAGTQITPTLELTLHTDFKPVLPPSTATFKAQQIPLDVLMAGFLPKFAEVHGGLASMPPATVSTPVTVAFQGLDGDNIARTIRVDQAAFRIESIRATAQARGDGNGDGLMGMLGLGKLPESMDRIFGVRDGKFTVGLKAVYGTVSADGAGNVALVQPIVIEGEDTADYEIHGRLVANAVPANSQLDFTVYVVRNMAKLVDVGEWVGKGLSQLGREQVRGISSEDIVTRMGAALEKEAQARRIAMPVQGTLGAPEVKKGIADFLVSILAGASAELGMDIGKDLLIDALGKSGTGQKLMEKLGDIIPGSTSTDPNAAQQPTDALKGALNQFLNQPAQPAAPNAPAAPQQQPADALKGALNRFLNEPAPAPAAPTQPAQPAQPGQPAPAPTQPAPQKPADTVKNALGNFLKR